MQGEPLHQTALHASARALLQAPQSPTRGASALQQLVQAREATGRGGCREHSSGHPAGLGRSRWGQGPSVCLALRPAPTLPPPRAPGSPTPAAALGDLTLSRLRQLLLPFVLTQRCRHTLNLFNV